jgi:hypothetical protein
MMIKLCNIMKRSNYLKKKKRILEIGYKEKLGVGVPKGPILKAKKYYI